MNECHICSFKGKPKFLCKVNLIYQTEYDLVECTNCGVIYFNPMPTTGQLAAFYSASYYNFDRYREEGKGMSFAKGLTKWKKTGKFLDIGCATGFFINGIKKNSDWEVYGTDFGSSAVTFAREKLKLDVREGDIKDAGFPDEYFDYVHVNNVLEHVPNPVSLLNECRRLVKPDGIFFLSVPNGYNDSLDLIDFYNIEKKPARSKSGHIFFFPAKTIRKMLDDAGFKIMTEKTYSFKRGFRSIGYLRRKSNWKKDYYPSEAPEVQTSSEVVLPDEKKKHSDFYYKYHFVKGNLQMLPGLHKSGLDFLFILKPKNQP